MKSFKTIICLSVMVLSIYSAVMLSLPMYRHYSLQKDMDDIVTYKFRPEEHDKLIREKIAESELPVNPEDISVTIDEKGVAVSLKWSETVDLLGVYQKTFDFEVKSHSTGG